MGKLNPIRSSIKCISPSQHDVHQAATAYVAAGLSLVPIATNGTQRIAKELLRVVRYRDGSTGTNMRMFQKRLPTSKEINKWFSLDADCPTAGIGVVCGRISGGLEVLEIEPFNIVEPFTVYLNKWAPGLFERLVKVKTPLPSLQLYYRSNAFGWSQTLARVPDKVSAESNPRRMLIELKGEWRILLAPPSPGCCHPSGHCYEYLEGPDLRAVPNISAHEREALHQVGRYHRMWQEADWQRAPGDDFNARANWAEILMPHGWCPCSDPDDECIMQKDRRWVRIDDTNVTLRICEDEDGNDWLMACASYAHPFQTGRDYDRFGAYTLLNHNGDFHKAARALRAKGYGMRPQGALAHVDGP